MATKLKQGKIQFWADHRPALQDGDYTVTVTHTVQAAGKIAEPPFATTRNFSVLGPRFSLDPQEIQAVFPPEGSLGEHSNVLPHIILKRATLPWERSADNRNHSKPQKDRTDDPSWLALLVFHEGEEPTVETVTLGQLGFPQHSNEPWGSPDKTITDAQGDKKARLFYTKLQPEYGQHADDQVQLITVDAELLEAIVPLKRELVWLAHVRQAIDPTNKPVGEPFAVLFANRLPKPSQHTTVHLVSLEGLYDEGGFYYKDRASDICLISLKSWRFACVSPDHDFKNLLSKLNHEGFYLPSKKDSLSERYLQQGLVPLGHAMRQGNRTVSWYRGPLLPGANPSPVPTLPVPNADHLVRYDAALGMFDMSYAGAWELGHLLALQNKRISVELFNWKRSHAQQQKAADNQLAHLPIFGEKPAIVLPDVVQEWFSQLSLLNGVPSNYLLPDERLLPPESIRFFQVDPVWIACLLDGAFGVGRVLAADFARDQEHKRAQRAPSRPPQHEIMTGFLLRSAVVAGYPELQVDGYGVKNQNLFSFEPELSEAARLSNDGVGLETALAAWQTAPTALQAKLKQSFPLLANANTLTVASQTDSWLINKDENQQLYLLQKEGQTFVLYHENKLPLLRIARLSSSVLLCLFAGQIQMVDIHQKPESLHFGFSPGDNQHTDPNQKPYPYFKPLRDAEGRAQKSWLPVEWHDETRRVVDVDQLTRNLKATLGSLSGAQFALEMIEGVEKVRFIATSPVVADVKPHSQPDLGQSGQTVHADAAQPDPSPSASSQRDAAARPVPRPASRSAGRDR